MMSVKVEFIDVGANNHSWTAEIKELTHDELYGAVKARGSIMSSCIDFGYDEESKRGQVVVGEVRIVGEFKVIDTLH